MYDKGKKFNKVGGSKFGKKNFGGNDRERQMTRAVCDSCGVDCKVPFKPTEGKPVFCSECFEKKSSDGGNRGRDSYRRESSFGRGRDSSYGEGRDSYRKESSFGGGRPSLARDRGAAPSNKDIEQINSKLDKILKILTDVDV